MLPRGFSCILPQLISVRYLSHDVVPRITAFADFTCTCFKLLMHKIVRNKIQSQAFWSYLILLNFLALFQVLQMNNILFWVVLFIQFLSFTYYSSKQQQNQPPSDYNENYIAQHIHVHVLWTSPSTGVLKSRSKIFCVIFLFFCMYFIFSSLYIHL